MNKPTTTRRFRHALTSMAAVALLAGTFATGCAVQADEPLDASVELVDDLEAADASGAYEVADDQAPLDREAILEDIARDYEMGQLSDRELVLVEIINRQNTDPSPELAEVEVYDPSVVERERIDFGDQVPGVEVGQ